MFRAITGAATLRDALDSVSILVDECRTRFNEESLSIHAIDPANVGTMGLMLDTTAFEFYEAHGGVIGVNLSHLEEVVGTTGAGDLIHLVLNEEARKLDIRIDGLSYTFALIDPDSIRQELNIPDFDLAANVALEGTHLDRGIKAADMVSDHVRLRVDGAEETSHIKVEGDTDGVDLSLPSADPISIKAGATDSLFSLDYLKDTNKAIPTDTEVTAELGEGFPIKLHYQIVEGMGIITYMFAPCVQSD